ncbi:MAG: hypothetical protein ACJ8MO_05640, partial [Bacillus sp. (in: firmicutes)]
LSINDIKVTLQRINQKIIKEEMEVDSFYTSYLKLTHQNVENFKVDIEVRVYVFQIEFTEDDDGNSEYLKQVLMISSLVHMSNLYRKVAEKLVDDITVEKEVKRHK